MSPQHYPINIPSTLLSAVHTKNNRTLLPLLCSSLPILATLSPAASLQPLHSHDILSPSCPPPSVAVSSELGSVYHAHTNYVNLPDPNPDPRPGTHHLHPDAFSHSQQHCHRAASAGALDAHYARPGGALHHARPGLAHEGGHEGQVFRVQLDNLVWHVEQGGVWVQEGISLIVQPNVSPASVRVNYLTTPVPLFPFCFSLDSPSTRCSCCVD